MSIFNYDYLTFLLLWPWPSIGDLDLQNWPRYCQHPPAYNKHSF